MFVARGLERVGCIRRGFLRGGEGIGLLLGGVRGRFRRGGEVGVRRCFRRDILDLLGCLGVHRGRRLERRCLRLRCRIRGRLLVHFCLGWSHLRGRSIGGIGVIDDCFLCGGEVGGHFHRIRRNGCVRVVRLLCFRLRSGEGVSRLFEFHLGRGDGLLGQLQPLGRGRRVAVRRRHYLRVRHRPALQVPGPIAGVRPWRCRV